MKCTVFVSGCFDLLHSGHVAFLQEAAQYGQLYVALGSDQTIFDLKKRWPINDQNERKYLLEALGCIYAVRISSGSGMLDFLSELDDIRPDIFIVNEDGNSTQKAELCRTRGIEYLVLKRTPNTNLQPRSTTALRTECTIPYRIDLAGGWLDQPFVSQLHSGPVLTISIEPTHTFNLRSGMSTSTRRCAIELWTNQLPSANPEHLAKILFSYENPPGTTEVAGSQDALGIVMPGLNYLGYAGKYWPKNIVSYHDEATLQWLERHLWLVPLGPREDGYSVLADTNTSTEGVKKLAEAAENCWAAILRHDIIAFGAAFRASFEAQIAMFPNMFFAALQTTINQYEGISLGHKLSGAGGGGYLILVSETPIAEALQIRIRRRGV